MGGYLFLIIPWKDGRILGTGLTLNGEFQECEEVSGLAPFGKAGNSLLGDGSIGPGEAGEPDGAKLELSKDGLFYGFPGGWIPGSWNPGKEALFTEWGIY